MVHALVPIKTLAEAKSRLAPLLSPDERATLALAMLADVLMALRATAAIARVSVVGGDTRALAVAHDYGANIIADDGELNAALARATATRFSEGARPLIVFADLPLATPAEFAQFVAHGQNTDVVLASATDGGTNALLAAPGLPLLFGSNSLTRHVHAAEHLAMRTTVVDLPGLSRDIDQPADLWWLAERGAATQAGRLAKTLLALV